MNVQISGARIGEQLFDHAFELRAFDQFPAGYHAIGIEAADRKGAFAQLLRHGIDGVEGLFARRT